MNVDYGLIDKIISNLRIDKTKGDELIPKYCPFCNGGSNKDKETFSFNKSTGLYNCLRGSCGQAGNAYQLAKHLGIETQSKTTYFANTRKEKVYTKPPWHNSGLSQKILDYFKLRGISEKTLAENKITEHKGNIVFNYYLNNELEFVKYKIPRKPKKGENKSWREAGTKPILYGMDHCDPNKPLLIIEGEPDKLVLNECGIWNVVSIPSGTQEFEWVNICWEWLEQFKEIIIWGDNDQAGQVWIQQMINKLDSWKLKVVKCQEKDANILLYKQGKDAVLEHYYNAEIVNKKQLTDLAKIKRRDYNNEKAIPTGFQEMDSLLGGFHLGQLVIWSGYTGGGKSTFISNILINNLREFKTFAYSGELGKEEFKEIMDFQLLGKEKLTTRYCDVKKMNLAHPDPKYYDDLDEYYEENIFLFDSEEYADDKELFKVMSYAAKREDVKVFLIDNLMVVPMAEAGTEIEKTTKMILKFKNFAKVNNVLVHLVAHPRKPSGEEKRMNIYSVAGTANIVNLADRVIVVHKIKAKDIEDNENLEGYQTIVTIEKDRRYGVFGVDILFKFDFFSKRFYTNEAEHRKEFIKKNNKIYLESDNMKEGLPF